MPRFAFLLFLLLTVILTQGNAFLVTAQVAGKPLSKQELPEKQRHDSPAAPSEWRSIASDIELFEYSTSGSLLAGPLVLVRSSLSKHRLTVVRAAEFGLARAEVRTLCRLARASVCINASFFDEEGNPLGLIVSRGAQLHPVHQHGRTLTGVLEVTRQGIAILPRQLFRGHNTLEAIQAGPRLLVKGQRTTGLRDQNRSGRSVVCRDRQGRVLLGSTSAGFRGLTLEELQQALLSPLVACVDALNLDGGGSAQLFVAPRESSTPGTATVVSINGFDTVPVALALIAQ